MKALFFKKIPFPVKGVETGKGWSQGEEVETKVLTMEKPLPRKETKGQPDNHA